MTIPLTTSDVIHIAELLREDLEYTKAVIDSSQDMDDILEAQESMEKSRATLMKLGVSTINQIYELNQWRTDAALIKKVPSYKALKPSKQCLSS